MGTAGFYTGDSAYSIAWLGLGNRTAADAQLQLAFQHMLGPFLIWVEKAFGDHGNHNFITGAGGYVQNILFGYGGVRYDERGLSVRPTLPPGGVTELKLRRVALGTSAVDLVVRAGSLAVELVQGPPLVFGAPGAAPVPLTPGVVRTAPIPAGGALFTVRPAQSSSGAAL